MRRLVFGRWGSVGFGRLLAGGESVGVSGWVAADIEVMAGPRFGVWVGV